MLERLCGIADEPSATPTLRGGDPIASRLTPAEAQRVADAARRTLELKRGPVGGVAGAPYQRPDAPTARPSATPAGSLDRTIYDAKNGEDLPGDEVRAEGDGALDDTAANQAYDGLGDTYALFNDVYGWSSMDDKNLPLLATVHYSRDYDNAFWNGTQMVFGDGDGQIFTVFTSSLSVIGHELAHGFTQYTTNLEYQGQAGALNESISDVFGVMVEQYAAKQSADEATWLVGAELLAEGVKGVALRSMKAPGTAYDDPNLGKDPQPADMEHYVDTTEDNGGVHINSGIPNRAFYLAATGIGGNSWEGAGKVWFTTCTSGSVPETATFEQFAEATVAAAVTLYGEDATETAAVRDAWVTVGVLKAA
ncbi:M4 family metallopeptidase [Micrococcales bacterium 31B]|nr:M4 family metallopeptidase [Micrococcales bacterium 31B]